MRQRACRPYVASPSPGQSATITAASAEHELAVLWAEEWDLSREPLDRWRDGAAKTPAITSGRPVERIGDGGPVPIVEIRNSFQDESPALVSLQFYWPE